MPLNNGFVIVNNLDRFGFVPNQYVNSFLPNANRYHDIYNRIEYLLTPIINKLFKSALMNCANYILIGGKSIELFLKDPNLFSFDFDIHLFDINGGTLDRDKILFLDNLATNLNANLTPEIRFEIFRILLNYGLITNTNYYYYYYMYNDLFFPGKRSNIIYGIFFKINKDQLKLPYTNAPNNYVLALRDENDCEILDISYRANQLNQPNNNYLYYNVADCDYDSLLNFGIPITRANNLSFNFSWNLNGIGPHYSGLLITFYNLLKYLYNSPFGSFKYNRILRKIQSITNPKNLSITYLNFYTNPNTNNTTGEYNTIRAITDMVIIQQNVVYNDLSALVYRINPNIIPIRQLQFVTNPFIKNLRFTDYLSNFINYYSQNENLYFTNINKLSRSRLILFTQDLVYYDRLLLNSSNIYQLEQRIFDTCNNNDINNIIRNYTNTFSRIINRYNYINYFYINVLNLQNLLNSLGIQIPSQMQIDDLNTSFINIRNAQRVQLYNLLKPYIGVYRIQSLKIFNNGTYNYGNSINVGDTIYNYTYLSCSTSKKFNFIAFLDEFSILFRIVVNHSNDFIFINYYSYSPTEKELLINKNTTLRCIDKNYEIIEVAQDTFKDILCLTFSIENDHSHDNSDNSDFDIVHEPNILQQGGTNNQQQNIESYNYYNNISYSMNNNSNFLQNGRGLSTTIDVNIKNELLENLKTELVFHDIGTEIYNHTMNAINIISELDSILLEFNITRIRDLLNNLKLCNIDNEKLNEYINKVYVYLNNNTIPFYYNIYKFKAINKILTIMLSGLTFSLHEEDELSTYEQNRDHIYKLIEEIDNLLYNAELNKTSIEAKLGELKGLHIDEEILKYVNKVEQYLLNHDSLNNIERINAYNNIYIDVIHYNLSYQNRIIDNDEVYNADISINKADLEQYNEAREKYIKYKNKYNKAKKLI